MYQTSIRFINKTVSQKHTILDSVLLSYSQIFFSSQKWFASLLMLVTFFDFWSGISGLVGIVISNFAAWQMGYDKSRISQGLYGFNSMLVCLGLGSYYNPSIALFGFIAIASIFTFFITISLQGVFTKYGLPYLSFPFIISYWVITLASRNFTAFQISERGLYYLNDLYGMGGTYLLNLYDWWNKISFPLVLKTYFLSCSNIFFQNNVLTGMLIGIGIFFYSRIAFVVSLLSFYAVYYFYLMVGMDFSVMELTHLGFNYILSSIAIGSFFLIPSVRSFLWTILLIPITVLISISTTSLFAYWQLSILSLPFSVIVVMFLYVLKLRSVPVEGLVETPVHLGSPEKNLYSHINAIKRKQFSAFLPFSLPFWGEWTVSQAQDGEYTHKGEWKHAWDFVVTDIEDKTFQNEGKIPEDYFCYDKVVIAPADGTVEAIIDGVYDNAIGDVNTLQNWGNTVVIKHANFLYTKLSHLKSGSIKVVKGEYVYRGQVLATCGNSGRSPEPHLHFQIQSTPYIGSQTMLYPLGFYISNVNHELNLNIFQYPKLNEKLLNIEINPLIAKALHFIPGQKLKFEVWNDDRLVKNVVWEVHTDWYNNQSIRCKETGAEAWFYNNGYMHNFIRFEGNKKSELFQFFLAIYNVPLCFYQNLSVYDFVPIHLVFNTYSLFLQDLTAPVLRYTKSEFEIKCDKIDDIFYPQNIILKSSLHLSGLFVNNRKEFEISINHLGINSIAILQQKLSYIRNYEE